MNCRCRMSDGVQILCWNCPPLIQILFKKKHIFQNKFFFWCSWDLFSYQSKNIWLVCFDVSELMFPWVITGEETTRIWFCLFFQWWKDQTFATKGWKLDFLFLFKKTEDVEKLIGGFIIWPLKWRFFIKLILNVDCKSLKTWWLSLTSTELLLSCLFIKILLLLVFLSSTVYARSFEAEPKGNKRLQQSFTWVWTFVRPCRKLTYFSFAAVGAQRGNTAMISESPVQGTVIVSWQESSSKS